MKHISHTAIFNDGSKTLQDVYFANPLTYVPRIVDQIRKFGQVIEYSKVGIQEDQQIKISFKNGGDLSIGDVGGGNVSPARYLFESKRSFQPQIFVSQADSNAEEAMDDVAIHLSDLNRLYESQSLAGLGGLDAGAIESVSVGSSAQDVANFFSYAQDKISETVDGDVKASTFLNIAIGISQLFQMKSPELNDNSTISNKLLLSKLIKEKADLSDYNYVIVHSPSIIMATTGWAEFKELGTSNNGWQDPTKKISYALGNQKFYIRSLDAIPVKRYKITFTPGSTQLFSLQSNRSVGLNDGLQDNSFEDKKDIKNPKEKSFKGKKDIENLKEDTFEDKTTENVI